MKATFLFVVCCAIFGLSLTETSRCQNSTTLRREQLPPVMLPDKIPPTARTIAPFNRIKPGVSMMQVVAACGLPDADIGSGIHIYVYELSDGSRVRVGTPDAEQIIYLVQVLASGAERQILRGSLRAHQFRPAMKGRPTTRSNRRPTSRTWRPRLLTEHK